MNYVPTKHTIARARLRFGIAAEHVAEWINEMMTKAVYVAPNGDNRSVYQTDGVQIVIDEVTKAVVTLHSEIKTDFLRPTLERELRKLRREYIRNKRKVELVYAEALRGLAEMAINRAKARNPETRALIAERMADKQAEIDGYVTEMERMDDDFGSKKRAIELIAD